MSFFDIDFDYKTVSNFKKLKQTRKKTAVSDLKKLKQERKKKARLRTIGRTASYFIKNEASRVLDYEDYFVRIYGGGNGCYGNDIRYYLSWKEDKFIADSHDLNNLLLYSTSKGTIEDIKYLLKFGACIDTKDNYSKDETPIIIAIKRDSMECVNLLLSHGCDVNIKCGDGYTALMYAVFNNNIECVNALIAVGCDIDAKSDVGYTALMYATTYDYIECVNALISAGCNVNKYQGLITPLLNATINGSINSVKALINAGVNLDMRIMTDNYGDIALQTSVRESREEIMLDNDMLSYYYLDRSDTALMIALRKSDVKCVKLLIDAGANFDKICYGNTALTYALKNKKPNKNDMDCLTILLENVNIKSINLNVVRSEDIMHLLLRRSVPVGRNPVLNKVIRDLYDHVDATDKLENAVINFATQMLQK